MSNNKPLEVIKEAEKEKKAVPHFNIANFEMLKALSNVAEDFNAPIFVGTSEGERSFLGQQTVVDLIESLNKQKSEREGYQLFLNADHTYSMDLIKEAAESGYDSIIYDGASFPFEKNVKKTKEALEIVKNEDPDILVEGELGYIGKSSKVRKELPEEVQIKEEDLPTKDEAREFVERTGVDLLAPAVGNVHGMFSNKANPNLSIQRVKEIRQSAGVPLVLHGGSGIKDEDFKKAIKVGISMVHVSTEIRVAWKKTLKKSLRENEEIAPYKLLPEVIKAMESVMRSKMKLFGWSSESVQ